jgi:hypothetical protein
MTAALTDAEHEALDLTVQLWNKIVREVVAESDATTQDLREIAFHVHALQRMIMGNAAGRTYPDKYRLLGGQLPR